MYGIKIGELNTENKPLYDQIGDRYRRFLEIDPLKKGAQYPSALRMLGDVDGKKILDIGCGSGVFAEMLLDRGARVVGYDQSEDQIREAQEKLSGKGEFIVATPEKFTSQERFDDAVAVNVLMHAKDKRELELFFQSTFEHLNAGGTLCAVIHNPDYQRFDETIYARRFTRMPNGDHHLDFLLPDGEVACSVDVREFSREDYESAARKAGFGAFEWELIDVTSEAQQGNEEFWEGFEEDNPYTGFIAGK